MRERILTTLLRWLAILLILRIVVAILSNYPDYFPPNFDSLFLQDREETFRGSYRIAFYVHILVSPILLLNGLVLLSEWLRRHYRWLHRLLGRIQVTVLLSLMLPSSIIMAGHAFAGWPAGLSFLTLSLVTAACAVLGVVEARRHHYAQHRRWMLRCFILLCSAVALRLISGAISLLVVSRPHEAYILAAWSSWLIPLGMLEVFQRRPKVAPFALR